MNALKAMKKKRLEEKMKLVPSSFLIKYNREWSDTVWHVNRVFPHQVYVTKTPQFQHDLMDYDFILIDKKKDKYMEKEFYLGYFNVFID
jgi:hypothetical protein